MNNPFETMYIAPDQCWVDHSAAVQSAVDAACRQQIKVVVLPPRQDGRPWLLTTPVRLPSFFTVILSGCIVEAQDAAFVNAAWDTAVHTPATEAHKIFILGRKGAILKGLSDAPQIRFVNARDCRVAGLTFKGGSPNGLSAELF